MKKYNPVTSGLLAALVVCLALAAPALCSEDGRVTGTAATRSISSANSGKTSEPRSGPGPVLVAQDEGDIDESFNSHGQDTDEEMETDEARPQADTLKKEMPAVSTQAQIDKLVKGMRWFGQSAFLIEDGKRIYLDPFDLPGGLPAADIILITHDHYDHLSTDDVKKITKDQTVVISIAAAKGSLPGSVKDFRAVKPGDSLTVSGVRIDVVPAYNIGKQFHPKEKGYVGYIVHFGGRSIYHAGDTDFIPEMKRIKADIALLPIGGKYTMDATEAAKAANAMKPKVVIPMHWGKIVGSEVDVETFKANSQVPVKVLIPETKKAN